MPVVADIFGQPPDDLAESFERLPGRLGRRGAVNGGRLDELGGPYGDRALPGVRVDDRRPAGCARGKLRGHRLHEAPLDDALQRAGAELRLVAVVHQEVQRPRIHVQGAAPAHEPLAAHDVREELSGDGAHVVAAQAPEGDDPIEAVDEFGAEERLGRGDERALPILFAAAEADRPVHLPDAQVRGQDDDGVAEIGGAPRGVGQPALAEDLQQQVEHVVVGLLDLVEQHHAVRLPPHGGRQQSLGVVERAGEPLRGPRRIEFVHVQADEVVLATEEERGQGPGALRLPDPGRSHQQQRGQRPVRRVEAGLGHRHHVGQRLDRRLLADHALAQGREHVAARQLAAAVQQGQRQPRALVKLLVDRVAGHRRAPVLQRQVVEERRALAGELGVAGVAPLQVDDRRQDVGVEGASVPDLQAPPDPRQDAPRGRGVGRLDPQHVELVGQSAVALGEDPKRLGRHLRQHAHVAPPHVGLQHVGGRHRAVVGGAGPVQAEEVVEVQHVVAESRFAQNAQQPFFPLPDVGHAGDQPLRRQQPHVAPVLVRRPATRHPLAHRAVDDGRLADPVGADQRHRPPIGRLQQPHEPCDLLVTKERRVQLVRVEPVEATADPLQLRRAAGRAAAGQRRQLPPGLRPAPVVRIDVQVERGHPGGSGEAQPRNRFEGPPLVLDQPSHVFAHPPFSGLLEVAVGGDLEPQAGQARRERDAAAEGGERHEEEAALHDLLAEIDGEPVLPALDRRREPARRQRIVARFLAVSPEQDAELPPQAVHGPPQAHVAGLGILEEQRSAAMRDGASPRPRIRGDVDRYAHDHVPISESIHARRRRSTASRRSSASFVVSYVRRFSTPCTASRRPSRDGGS